ncbi:glycine/sarcosine/betaine reductase complex component C subunit alpha [Enterococcus sp. CSURQ0835]|uniref:glycine/sarcosine/betaine reductase complex component C subunit alpha n=1 Tax=Enterococcus sp. CSURQ0835 TaxID=2681394 RepID=UPI00135906B3|nr:glycine/sarcosine/betaine reductase complex component C subunit alpha [Enterococcus sp. CSURQ0835]
MSEQVNQTIKKVFTELATGLETGQVGPKLKIGLTIDGSELGLEVMKQAAYAIKQKNDFELVLIGATTDWTGDFEHLATDRCQKSAAQLMEAALASDLIQGCVTLHYNFPIGVSTVGKIVTPAFGKPLLIATTTGTTSAVRNEALVLNALNGIAVAKTLGIKQPTIGLLNIEGAKTAERALQQLKTNGYELHFGKSQRADGGTFLRGNDLLTASVDVVVCDSLTGNILMKLFSAYTSGGGYEVAGAGYGPGIGEAGTQNICIVSRASGAPVIENALEYAYQLAKGGLKKISADEYTAAKRANLVEICEQLKPVSPVQGEVSAPTKEIVTKEIAGIDILELEAAVQALWQAQIYAESGMGCTGPILLVNEANASAACDILQAKNYL